MVRMRKEPEVRRRELMAAATELFCLNGYEKTMVTDIVKKAGVAKGTFFYYFPTKEAIFIAICDSWAKAFLAEFHLKIQGIEVGAVEKLIIFLRLFEEPSCMDELADNLYAEHQFYLLEFIWQKQLATVFNPLLEQIVAEGCAEKSMQVEEFDDAAGFFWGIIETLWDCKQKDIAEDKQLKRYKLAQGLLEKLFGIRNGLLDISH